MKIAVMGAMPEEIEPNLREGWDSYETIEYGKKIFYYEGKYRILKDFEF